MNKESHWTAIRGAITIEQDSKEQIQRQTEKLFSQVIKENNLNEQNVVSIICSVTKDIRSINPVTVIRKKFNWNDTAMICIQEADFDGALELCIRFLIHVQLPKNQEIKNIYLEKAQSLRSDWVIS